MFPSSTTLASLVQALKTVDLRVNFDTALIAVHDMLMESYSKFVDAAVAEFREADEDGDGMLTELEYVRYVLSIIPTRSSSTCQASFAAVMDSVDAFHQVRAPQRQECSLWVQA